MFLVSMLLLFAAACVAGWLLMFPAGRDALGASLLGLGRGIEHRWRGMARHGVRGARSVSDRAAGILVTVIAWARHHALLSGSAAALVLVPPLLALFLGGRAALPDAGTGERAVDEQIASLLRGERLVAPPPLPPAVFTTAEVTLLRPQLAGANRNWDLLDPDFTQRLLLVFKVMREQYGYEMVLLEGYRSPARQNELADAGSHVTNARAFQSWHQFGLAGDCAFLRDGKVVISERDPWAMRGYQLYGQVAEAAGLTWGGRWKLLDFGHVELPNRRR
ncbi:peptidoglycan L-alanyl-D-glutamate endopeptidase CwlK [Pseudoduganella lurida]|uniref:Peptidoglycan L-alanyl-D-glutamate endopeptidase CwlK n=1 Tax=Pseudoduganella lurida TaxID=1036180 RepID=A0A562RDE1_9BURK|nr:M15 family metallopeptidase [Pseudoduganella lurida]TWI66436.1 peptidoglycan L-alanyl-D-glutamate endopeptidase CwlK [Pseudoduganella lurida]